MQAILPEEFYELQKIVKPYLIDHGKLSEDAPPEVKAAHERCFYCWILRWRNIGTNISGH